MDRPSIMTGPFWPLTSTRSLEMFPTMILLLLMVVVPILCYSFKQSKHGFPQINPPTWLTVKDSKLKFVRQAPGLLRKAYYTYTREAFSVMIDIGEVVILPPQFINDIKNDDRLSLADCINKILLPQLRGLEGLDFRLDHMKRVVYSDLAKHLNQVTIPLHQETSLALSRVLANYTEWHQVHLMPAVLQIVAQVSSRVFLGRELCRNTEWLDITTQYSVHGFRGCEEVRAWPAPLRHVAALFNKNCRAAKSLVIQARALLLPIIGSRRAEKQRLGTKYVPHNDSLEWFERTLRSGEKYDPAITQLQLSVAAIHTTTDLLCKVIGDILENPAIIQPLRDEILECLTNGGWQKSSLYNMKLLDSCIKESQRLKPISLLNMRRLVTQDTELPNGTIVPKGSMTALSAERFWDPEAYPDRPMEWDGHRFYRKRQIPGQENSSQLVTTSADDFAFGHGAHACPGRFFAANEVKMILAHLLLKYDWELCNGQKPEVRRSGLVIGADPNLRIAMRRREEEVDLDSFIDIGEL